MAAGPQAIPYGEKVVDHVADMVQAAGRLARQEIVDCLILQNMGDGERSIVGAINSIRTLPKGTNMIATP